jgi:hypothetical protein
MIQVQSHGRQILCKTQSPRTDSRCTTSPTMTCASVWMRERAEHLYRQQLQSTSVGPRPTFKFGTLTDSAFVFNHLNDSRSRCQQNLPSFTTNWQLGQMENLNLTFVFTLHYSDGIGKMLLTYMFCLPVPNTQCTYHLPALPQII